MVKTKEDERDVCETLVEVEDENSSQEPTREDVRAKILEATSHIARTEGLDAATPTRIFTATGIARSTIYRHWPKRVELLRTAIEVDEHLPWGEQPRAGSAANALRLAAEAFEDEIFVRMLASIMSQSDAGRDEGGSEWRDFANQLLKTRLKPLFDYIDQAFEQGRVRDGVDRERLLGVCLGPLLYHRLLLDAPCSQAFINQQVEVLNALVVEAGHETEKHGA